jgi:hypothetical protein
MLNQPAPATNQTVEDRETRRQHLLQALRHDAESILDRMADALVDLPEAKSFGQIEYTLRDLGHELAASAHQAGLEAGKKRGTLVPARSARTARATPASSPTAPRPG